MGTLGNTRSVVREADPQKWRFQNVTPSHENVPNSSAATVSSLCVAHVMQSQPGNLTIAYHAFNESLDGCHLKMVPLQTWYDP